MRAISTLLDALMTLLERFLPGRAKLLPLVVLAGFVAFLMYVVNAVKLARWI